VVGVAEVGQGSKVAESEALQDEVWESTQRILGKWPEE
jgi:hypothetical protein